MDNEILDPMNNEVWLIFLNEWLKPILFLLLSGYIVQSLRKLNKSRKLLEIKVDAMAYAMGQVPPPTGDHFKENYEKKVRERLKEEQFLN